MQSAAFLQGVLFPKREKTAQNELEETKNEAIIDEIKDVLQNIKCVESRFDYETEPDMIDSLIYEHQALLSRYRHLMSLAKQNGARHLPAIH